MNRARSAGVLAALATTLTAAAPAAGAGLLSTQVTAPAAVARDCHAKLLPAGTAGTAHKSVTIPAAGLVGARLEAADGDWDVAIFDERTGRTVAASAGFGARELAEGFVGGGRAVVLQACRRTGAATGATLSAFTVAVPAGTAAQRASLVRVETPTPAAKTLLGTLGLDLTEHGGAGYVEAVAYGAEDLEALRDAGLAFRTVDLDLTAQAREDRAADRAFARRVGVSGLPSGRTGYRHLYDYEADMKALAAAAPELVKPITLNHPTLEGRQVHGVEITSDAARSDGKPVFLQMGVHHAREWPSGEHAMEWAFELVRGYGRDPRITDLVRRVRTIVVPVVNPDGFNLSREAPVDLVEDPEFQSLPDLSATAAYLIDPAFAYKRRNCRVIDGQAAPGGICALPTFRASGVDPNRNYGGLWGGPGASALPLYDTYRGAGPFSEPETQNVRELISSRQVTTLITNHTFSNLVLRPPGVRAQGPPPDEAIYADLGARMAAENGYTNQPSYALYDTTGTTEDWSYYATGGLGFTFEIGPDAFHPAFERTVEEYEGGNRAAYLIAMENAADAARHSRLTGRAPAGAKLTLSKAFVTETSPVEPAQLDVIDGAPSPAGEPQTFMDRLETSLAVPASGAFSWAVNPSTRPAAMERRLPTVADKPARTATFTNQTRTQPNQVAGEGAEGTFEDIALDVRADDEARVLRLTLTGAVPADDYDLELYRQVEGELVPVATSGNVANPEEILLDDPPVGSYVLRVVNFLAVGDWTVEAAWLRAGPDVIEPGTVEAWTLTCERPDGVTVSRKVVIARGEAQALSPCKA